MLRLPGYSVREQHDTDVYDLGVVGIHVCMPHTVCDACRLLRGLSVTAAPPSELPSAVPPQKEDGRSAKQNKCRGAPGHDTNHQAFIAGRRSPTDRSPQVHAGSLVLRVGAFVSCRLFSWDDAHRVLDASADDGAPPDGFGAARLFPAERRTTASRTVAPPADDCAAHLATAVQEAGSARRRRRWR